MATVLILGISVLDYVFGVERIPAEPLKYRSDRLAVVGGGLAANAAVAAARLGGRAQLLTRLGDDATADAILSDLRAEGVDCALVRRFSGRQSPVSAVFVDAAGERMVMSYSDPDMPHSAEWITPELLDRVDAVQGDNRWEAGALRLFALAAQQGLPSVLDCDRAPKSGDLLRLPSHVAFSEQGLTEVTGITDSAAALAHLRAEGFRNELMVTLGARGVMRLVADRPEIVPAYAVTVVDTLAAGDVWHGALTLALGERMPMDRALRFANAAAALKCTVFGGRSGTPRREAVEKFMRDCPA